MKKTSPPRIAKLASTIQQLPDLSPINMAEFNAIKFIKSQQSSKTSFRDLYSPITRVIERMKFFNPDQIKEMYDEKKKESIFAFDDIHYELFMNGYQDELRKLLENPVFFLMNNGAPFFKSRSNQPWSNEEDDLLNNIIHFVDNNPVFPLLTLAFQEDQEKQFIRDA